MSRSEVFNTEGIKAGCIYRIELINFVTYKKVVLYPSTSLNLIIGPNGTGKSTFVCAIILGLCGKTSVIGRAKKISEYVRSGCEDSKIEIELYRGPNERNVIITREFDVNDASSWFIDGRSAREKQVQELIASMNIQVDNLCQLLPQDRVQDFSKMNPQQLLRSTLAAVGGQESVDQLDELIQCRTQQRGLSTKLQTNTQVIEEAMRLNERLKIVIDAMKQRKEIEKQIEICEKKKLWLEYQDLREKVVEYTNDRKSAMNIVKTHQSKVEPLEKVIASAKTTIGKIEQQKLAANRKIYNLKEQAKETINAVRTQEFKLKEIEGSFQEKLERHRNRERELQEAKAKLEKLTTDKMRLVEKVGDETKVKLDLAEIHKPLTKTNAAIDNLKKQKLDVQYDLENNVMPQIRLYQNKIRKLEDVDNKRLEVLRAYSEDCYKAVMWLRENRDMFQHAVHEPMMLEISFTDPKFARYLESTVAGRDLVAFTFEDTKDMNLFLSKVRNELGLRRVNAICSQGNTPPRSQNIQQLSYLGFYTYLVDTISAPDAIVNYLCRQYNIHRIPIGNDHTFKNSGSVPANITMYFTGKSDAIVNYLCRQYNIHRIPIGNDHTFKNSGSVPANITMYFTGKSDAIVNYLCRQYNIHRIPIGNDHTFKNSGSVPANITMYFTGKSDAIVNYLCRQYNIHRIPIGNDHTFKNSGSVPANITMYFTGKSDAIVNYLCRQYNIHRIPIGNDHTFKNSGSVPANITMYFTGKSDAIVNYLCRQYNIHRIPIGNDHTFKNSGSVPANITMYFTGKSDAIVNYLCRQYNIHRIPIGNDHTFKNSGSVPANITMYFTGKSDAIVNYLCRQYNIHRIPIGNDHTFKNSGSVPANITMYFTGKSDAIVNYLCRQYNIHRIPIGNDHTFKNSGSVPANITMYFTGKSDAIVNYLCRQYNIHRIPIGNDHTFKNSGSVPANITMYFTGKSDAIVNYLCRQYNIHRIPIGNDHTFKNSGSVPANITMYFTGKSDAIVNYLCRQYNIHRIPIGNDHTFKNSGSVPANITMYFTGKSDAIVNYLCRQYNIHRIPIGNDHTFKNSGSVPANITMYFTENHRFVVRVSAYSGERSSSTIEIRPAKLCANTVDLEEISNFNEQLAGFQETAQSHKTKMQKIDERLSTLEGHLNELNMQRKAINEGVEKVRTIAAQIRIQKKKVEDIETEPTFDIQQERERARRKQRDCVLKQCRLHAELKDSFSTLCSEIMNADVWKAKLEFFRNGIVDQENELRELKNELRNVQATLENIENQLTRAKSSAKEKLIEAKRSCNNKLPQDPDFPYREDFDVLPSDITRLQEHYYELQTRVDFMDQGDEQVIKEYEEREKQIAKLKSEVNSSSNMNKTLEHKIRDISSKWLPPLENLLRDIDRSFGDMFSKLGCAGEIKLDKGGNEEDYDKYGISILVCFRASEQLQQLTRHAQSGGERALSTALYLMSLQRLTTVPFRCVDEINQGMDPINERKMFELLVNVTTESDNAQYFLLTPKLLTNLQYNEKVMVHTIMNGQKIMPNNAWKMETFLEKAHHYRMS
ncbi:hypothetical protein PYW07_010582 [Mythimna separata]|uniref:Structural maintenance of chromosomes protein 5 n=1 Tax=Mythimna separata TaxID=271217 RepID=A0AAD7YA38_MYTSE|nr:hypothetical protein PYW07_010582 [Mythimna separata]